eukprot:TRINITY_DN4656_c0_g1_i1.p1 TRINITY_DN4656_c0_g1~~TRINITY_DN4656_c0_g1_i1.p1  ORF type:complete len:325 (+),score=59.37 TRINITY_DN4656_c0_g1_i1:39-1013(+)
MALRDLFSAAECDANGNPLTNIMRSNEKNFLREDHWQNEYDQFDDGPLIHQQQPPIDQSGFFIDEFEEMQRLQDNAFTPHMENGEQMNDMFHNYIHSHMTNEPAHLPLSELNLPFEQQMKVQERTDRLALQMARGQANTLREQNFDNDFEQVWNTTSTARTSSAWVNEYAQFRPAPLTPNDIQLYDKAYSDASVKRSRVNEWLSQFNDFKEDTNLTKEERETFESAYSAASERLHSEKSEAEEELKRQEEERERLEEERWYGQFLPRDEPGSWSDEFHNLANNGALDQIGSIKDPKILNSQFGQFLHKIQSGKVTFGENQIIEQ